MDAGPALGQTALNKTALSETSFEIAPPKDMKARTPSCAEGFTFTKLPAEIRLIIYKELLVRNNRPELCFCSRDLHRAYSQLPKFGVHPAILRTCKTIYYEALPILYTENVFEILCVFGQLGKQYLWYRTCGPSLLLTCPTPQASIYLQQVFLTFTDIIRPFNDMGLNSDDIKQFARCWPRIEQETLELYPNVKSIFVQIHQENFQSICLKLARRHESNKAEAKRKPNCLAVLKKFDLQQSFSKVYPQAKTKIYPTPPKLLLINNHTFKCFEIEMCESIHMRNDSISRGTCSLLCDLLHVAYESTSSHTTS